MDICHIRIGLKQAPGIRGARRVAVSRLGGFRTGGTGPPGPRKIRVQGVRDGGKKFAQCRQMHGGQMGILRPKSWALHQFVDVSLELGGALPQEAKIYRTWRKVLIFRSASGTSCVGCGLPADRQADGGCRAETHADLLVARAGVGRARFTEARTSKQYRMSTVFNCPRDSLPSVWHWLFRSEAGCGWERILRITALSRCDIHACW